MGKADICFPPHALLLLIILSMKRNETRYSRYITAFCGAVVAVLCVLVLEAQSPAQAQAQDHVNVRSAVHPDYTRAVFDWSSTVSYAVERLDETRLQVSFERVGTPDYGDMQHHERSGITGIEAISGSGAPLRMTITTPAGVEFRHFAIGGRVVVDVLYRSGSAPSPPSSAPPSTPPQAQRSPPPAPPSTPDRVSSAPSPASAPAPTVEPPETVPPPAPLQHYMDALEAHVITLSTTETLGLAVFRRGDDLWLVADRPGLRVAPRVSGPQSEKFPAFDRMEIQGGTAFRMRLPAEARNHFIFTEGGGLVWRVVLTQQERETRPVPLSRTFSSTYEGRGGTLHWDMGHVGRQLTLTDTKAGDVIKVVTVGQADQYGGAARKMVDLEVFESAAGIALRPVADDLEVVADQMGVHVRRPGGLALSRASDVAGREIDRAIGPLSLSPPAQDDQQGMTPIFDFDRWMMGGLQALSENQRILMSGMGNRDRQGRVQNLLTLAKMNIANGRGQEALGFLSFAENDMAEIAASQEFQALRGAASALAGRYEAAFLDLSASELEPYDELDYWRAYALASLEDWQQAIATMPSDLAVLFGYPPRLLEQIGIKLAEIFLRDGNVVQAERILSVLQGHSHTFNRRTLAAIDYLKGEAHRQSDEIEAVYNLWRPLGAGRDDMYRVRSNLALTMLELDQGGITLTQAIDRLERLRYAWRGDEIEARVNFMLGRLYLESGDYLKGLAILRDAATMSPDSEIGREITYFMQSEFQDVLMHDQDITPFDAVHVYQEFIELTPPGDAGNNLAQRLAERLVEADLLGRAAAILKHQVDYRLEGEEKARVAARLGSVYLLNRQAEEALDYLDIAKNLYETHAQDDADNTKIRDIDMMRARGLSRTGKTEEALTLLNAFPLDPDVNRLRADIAWQAGLWEDAADALHDMMIDDDISPQERLTDRQAGLILNRAVALNLSGDRVALSNMRRLYGDAMRSTSRARLFEIVTRERQTTIMADRDTIEQIVSEVDMFEEFLKNYDGSAF